MFALLLLLFLATTAYADKFGPVTVETLDGVAPMHEGNYYEYRFVVFNPTAEPHTVRLDVESILINSRRPLSSRTVVAAPRATAIVSIPQFIPMDHMYSLANVSVDDEDRGRLRIERVSNSRYRSGGPDVLFGRNVPQQLVSAMSTTGGATAIRSETGASSWSTNWLHYTSLGGMVLAPRDWTELPPPVQSAVLRWVSAGGSITFTGPVENLPPLRPADSSALSGGHLGFGWIGFLDEDVPIPATAPTVIATWRNPEVPPRYIYVGGMNELSALPLLDDASLPMKSLFSVLVVFAIVGGPINIWILAKKQRRLWIFWTLPALAIVTGVILIGSLIMSEGWVRIHRTSSLTLLDERRGEASTLGWTGVYATLSPEPNVRFDNATEVRPLGAVTSGVTDWTDGQRFVSGWIGSRLASGFAVRKVEPRRERVPIRREAGQLVAVNGLGCTIKRLLVADEQGVIHVAQDIAAGKEVVLTRTAGVASTTAKDPATLLGEPESWSTYVSRLSAKPADVLRPGMYVAIVSRSPFIEAAVPKPTKYTSDAVIIGLLKGIGDAG